MFGSFFGRQVPMKGGSPSGALPVSPGPAAGRPAPVIGQTHTVPAVPAAPAAQPAPPGSFQQAPLIPPTRVPMGAKKDCPVCRG